MTYSSIAPRDRELLRDISARWSSTGYETMALSSSVAPRDRGLRGLIIGWGDGLMRYENWSDAQSSLFLWTYEVIPSDFWWTLCQSLFPLFMGLLFGLERSSFWTHNFPQLGFRRIPYTVAKKFSHFLYLCLFILFTPKYYIRDKLIASAVI